MLPTKRKQTIVEIVSERGGCSVAELAEELGFSKATIRRDLGELEEKGRIERNHGGAMPVTGMSEEPSHRQKKIRHLKEKRAIAERAVEEIHSDQVVCFDTGTTTIEVAKRAPKEDTFLGVTNSPIIAQEFAANETTVKLTGGTLRPETQALIGPTAEEFIDRTNFDTLFLGTNGVDAEAGLTTPSEEEAEVKSNMIEAASRVILVADSSKIGEFSFIQFASLADVDLFITDEPVPDEFADRASEVNLTIIEVSK